MNTSLPSLMLVLLSFFLPQQNTPQNELRKPQLKLVWADEFNTDGPVNPANWIFEEGFVRNEEAQWYQRENAVCRGGLLIIEARREKKANPGYVAGSADWRKNRPMITYTSACLKTQGLKQFRYGRFEMRARIDTAAGLWPAFWTLGVNHPWPSNGEIDIMEYYRGMLLANIAHGTGTPNKAFWYDPKKPLSSFKDPAWAKKFHVWRMDWTPEEISLFVDGEVLNRVPLNKLVNHDGSGFNPFMQEHYMLLNMAIGGMNGGDPLKTTFPRRFEVDYVRVYQ